MDRPNVANVPTLSSNPAPNPASDALTIDVISDVVCPWCFIGKRKLEAALDSLKASEPALAVAVRWHPFQLNPDMPAAGVPRDDYLAAKFGAADRAAAIYARVKAVGEDVGIPFAFERITRQPNTLEAHRLIAWAQARGDLDAAGTLVERLFHAYFIKGEFLGDPETLVRAADDAGFDADAARAMLASDEGRDVVAGEDRESRSVGIQGVPFFIFNGRTAVSGAHDPPTLLDAIGAARQAR